MGKVKKLIIVLLILIIIIGIVIVGIIIYGKKNGDRDSKEDNAIFVDKVKNVSTKYEVYDCIEKVISYLYEDHIQAKNTLNITNKTIDNLQKENLIRIKDIKIVGKVKTNTIFADIMINEIEYMFVLDMDYTNYTFKVLDITKEILTKEKIEQKIALDNYTQDEQIEKNEYNVFEIKKNLSETNVAKLYYNQYKQLCLYNSQIAYLLIDEDYKQQVFDGEYKEYEKYIQSQKDVIEEGNFYNYTTTVEQNYKTYTIKDTKGLVYVIKEYDFMNYTIQLDNYSITSEEYTQKYMNASNVEKVNNNINIVLKMINNKDYTGIYALLDSTFRSNNFKTEEELKQYIEKHFFDNNYIGKITIKEQGVNYAISVPYKERASAAAEERTKIFIMKLGEETSFTISFEV